jgi:hypothetical protein
MIESLRAFPLLTGARGRPMADLEALHAALMGVQRIAIDLDGHFDEFEINPLIVRPAGRGALAVDALATRLPR